MFSSQANCKKGIKVPFSQVTNPKTKNKAPIMMTGLSPFLRGIGVAVDIYFSLVFLKIRLFQNNWASESLAVQRLLSGSSINNEVSVNRRHIYKN